MSTSGKIFALLALLLHALVLFHVGWYGMFIFEAVLALSIVVVFFCYPKER